ncbi:MAG: hypothetical protein LC792_15040 [Actinobacteria bacterium]|nr:hypothetical protein [Actinomycetota bacterium]
MLNQSNRRQRHKRLVVTVVGLREGRGSVLGPDTFRRTRWWELRLECGHLVERTVRYRYREHADRGRRPRRADEVTPAPRWAYCEFCPSR